MCQITVLLFVLSGCVQGKDNPPKSIVGEGKNYELLWIEDPVHHVVCYHLRQFEGLSCLPIDDGLGAYHLDDGRSKD